jgi:L-ribulokinase
MPIKVAKTEQACAFGAAMFAAAVAGVYPDIQSAQKAMGQGFLSEYLPNEENHRIYSELYQKYLHLGKCTELEFSSNS